MFSNKGSHVHNDNGHLDGLQTSDYGIMTTISSYEQTSDYRRMKTISSYEQTSSVNVGPKELVCFIDNILQSLLYKYV